MLLSFNCFLVGWSSNVIYKFNSIEVEDVLRRYCREFVLWYCCRWFGKECLVMKSMFVFWKKIVRVQSYSSFEEDDVDLLSCRHQIHFLDLTHPHSFSLQETCFCLLLRTFFEIQNERMKSKDERNGKNCYTGCLEQVKKKTSRYNKKRMSNSKEVVDRMAFSLSLPPPHDLMLLPAFLLVLLFLFWFLSALQDILFHCCSQSKSENTFLVPEDQKITWM